MTNEAFAALVERVERYANTNPTAYRFRAGALAVLGYAYVWAVLLVCLVLLAVLAYLIVQGDAPGVLLKLAIPLVVLVGAVLRGLWVSFPPPQGVRVRPTDVPALFALIDELMTHLDTPRFHRVVITDDFNAAVSQRPLLGPFGGYQNWLILGLPMLEALSLDEYRAVLAHELGHLSRAHGRFGAWIYRIRVAWTRIITQLESNRRWGHQVFEWFLERWAPYFNAYSFVLARRQEYEADRQAAQLAGADALARALVTMTVQGERIDTFWRGVARRAAEQAVPPTGVLEELRAAMQSEIPPSSARRWITGELSRTAAVDDTHPTLNERLKALGFADLEWSRAAARAGTFAADALLGAARGPIASQVEQRWRSVVERGWREKHTNDVERLKRLRALEEKATSATLNNDESSELAQLALYLRDPDQAMESLRALLARNPQQAHANFSLGNALLERNDPAGIAYLETAMARDPQAVAPGLQRLWLFYSGIGETDRAADYQRRWTERLKLMEQAAPERQHVEPEAELLPHGLPDDEVLGIRNALLGMSLVGDAFLVRKRVTILSEEPFYVLGVEHVFAKTGVNDADEQSLVDAVAREVRLPGDWLVVALGRRRPWLRPRMEAIPGAQLKEKSR